MKKIKVDGKIFGVFVEARSKEGRILYLHNYDLPGRPYTLNIPTVGKPTLEMRDVHVPALAEEAAGDPPTRPIMLFL